VCSEELALHTAAPASASAALIAGLLHDVGQLWLYRFKADSFSQAWPHALANGIGIEQAERERFGVDHSVIGAWLAEHWTLPANIVTAIRCHHAPEQALGEPLVPVVHVAEVVSNALDLTGREENHVTSISSAACSALGLTWDESARVLFGRMEARSRHANALFGS
jgi:HD-like signal output (HDOD) protein